MAFRRGEDWLGPTIEAELEAAIIYSSNSLSSLSTSSVIKPDPEGSSFSDDGSNLRVSVAPYKLRDVQLVKVLAVRDPTTCLITDGFTEIRATLSRAAVTALEHDLDEKLNTDVKYDIFRLSAATVFATPYGTPEARTHIVIDNLEYQYSLRKPVGQAIPVQERPKMAKLIERLMSLRQEQLAQEEQENSLKAGPSQSQDLPWSSSPVPVSIPRTVSMTKPKPNSDAHCDPTFKSHAVPATQMSPSKVLPSRQRSKAGPTLGEDGIEIQSGVNLTRPTGRAAMIDKQHTPSTKPPSATTTMGNRTAMLANVLGKRKHPEPSSVSIQFSTQLPAPQLPSKTVELPEETLPDPPVSQNKIQLDYSLEAGPKSRARDDIRQVQPYTRRPVPVDQQRLLDMKSSWWPSLPGERFPQPNVPIALLERWNQEQTRRKRVVEAASQPQLSASPTRNSDITGKAGKATVNYNEVETSSSDDSSSSDEELGESQWPVSPTPRQSLPPDSTLESPQVKATPMGARLPAERSTVNLTDEMETAVPRALKDPAALHRQVRSEYFRTEQRRAWLKAHQTPASIKAAPLIRLMQQYKDAHPNDVSVTIESFDGAIKDVFPIPLPSETFPAPAPSQPTQKALPAQGREEQRKMEAVNDWIPVEQHAAAHNEASAANDDEMIWAADTVTPFNEFALAWRSLKPGGAWAAVEPNMADSRKVVRRVNVFDWEI